MAEYTFDKYMMVGTWGETLGAAADGDLKIPYAVVRTEDNHPFHTYNNDVESGSMGKIGINLYLKDVTDTWDYFENYPAPKYFSYCHLDETRTAASYGLQYLPAGMEIMPYFMEMDRRAYTSDPITFYTINSKGDYIENTKPYALEVATIEMTFKTETFTYGKEEITGIVLTTVDAPTDLE